MSFLVSNDKPLLGAATQIALDPATGQGPLSNTNAKVPREVYVTVSGLAATSTSLTAWISDDAYQVVSVKAIFGTAGGAGAAVTVEKASDGTAVGAGTAVLSSTIALTGTANTAVSGTLAANLNTIQIASGQHLNVVLSGTLTGLANAQVIIALMRV